MQETLFPSGPTARPTDPDTSQAAGKAQPVQSELHRAILDLFTERLTMTDDELVGWFPGRSPGSVIKRRGELARAGFLVDSGERRPTRYGRDAIVWARLFAVPAKARSGGSPYPTGPRGGDS